MARNKPTAKKRRLAKAGKQKKDCYEELLDLLTEPLTYTEWLKKAKETLKISVENLEMKDLII